MDSFYITLQSDSSLEHFPSNTITSFRNHFGEPIRLDEHFEVALVECSYVHSSRIFAKGEFLGQIGDGEGRVEDLKAPVDLFSVEDIAIAVTEQKQTARHSYIRLGYESIEPRPRGEGKKIASIHNTVKQVVLDTENFGPIPRLYHILGWDGGWYGLEVFGPHRRTQLYIYCDIVQHQRIGHERAPLIRKMTYTGKHGELLTRSFSHLEYRDIAYNEFDRIWIYLRNESGEPPPLMCGSFSCTLHFRRRRY